MKKQKPTSQEILSTARKVMAATTKARAHLAGAKEFPCEHPADCHRPICDCSCGAPPPRLFGEVPAHG